MACQPVCKHDSSCFFNAETRDTLLNINCKLKELIHRCQCCSTRARGDDNSYCHRDVPEQEVTSEKIKKVLEEIEQSARALCRDVGDHEHVHQLQRRSHKGREGRQECDSGIASMRRSGTEEAIAGLVDTMGVREPEEHKEDPMDGNTNL